jgi:hypothetical protein
MDVYFCTGETDDNSGYRGVLCMRNLSLSSCSVWIVFVLFAFACLIVDWCVDFVCFVSVFGLISREIWTIPMQFENHEGTIEM